MQMFPSLYEAIEQVVRQHPDGIHITPSVAGITTEEYASTPPGNTEQSYLTTTARLLEDNSRLRSDISKLYDGLSQLGSATSSENLEALREKRGTNEHDVNNNNKDEPHAHVVSYAQNPTKEPDGGTHREPRGSSSHDNNSHGNQTRVHPHVGGGHGNAHTDAERLLEIAHYLHYCSIGILGIFVAQVGSVYYCYCST